MHYSGHGSVGTEINHNYLGGMAHSNAVQATATHIIYYIIGQAQARLGCHNIMQTANAILLSTNKHGNIEYIQTYTATRPDSQSG